MSGKYYKTKESVAEYIKLAEGIDGSLLIEKLKHFLNPDSYLLEIGSGPGTDWNILNKTFEVTGSDFSKIFLYHLQTENPQGTFLNLDAITLNTEIKFDGIYSNKVLHHLKDSELIKSVKRQSEILKPDGIICHSFWKGEDTEIFKGLFVNYHNKLSLNKFFGDYFEIISIDDYKEFEDGDSLLLIGKKKVMTD